LKVIIDRLPFTDGSFDAVWCAQSPFSLREPVDAVTRMARAVKPGGLVAVLEDDTLHQVLLPWPVDVELAVRKAEWESFREEADHPDLHLIVLTVIDHVIRGRTPPA
jgi:SAM-dependent methyltransferase